MKAAVYVAVAAFENSARELVTTVLRAAVGDEWWETCVASGVSSASKTSNESA
jgi:hypothetical protein